MVVADVVCARRVDDERHAAHGVVSGVTLAKTHVIAEPLTVIRGEDDDCVIALARRLQRFENPPM